MNKMVCCAGFFFGYMCLVSVLTAQTVPSGEHEVRNNGDSVTRDGLHDSIPQNAPIDMPSAGEVSRAHSSTVLPAQNDRAADVLYNHVFENGVSAIADAAHSQSFFAAGKDGFVLRYEYPALRQEVYQVSDLPIKLLAAHPKKLLIAVYATDGFGVHTIAVWDWKHKKQVYAKRFASTVLSLSWSAQGSYLFVGTASSDGITVFDRRGKAKNIYSEPPGIVLLAATGQSEKSIVTYGETGRLVYANVAKRSILVQYATEDRLQNPQLFKHYTRIVGYKNGFVIVVNAVSGNVLERYGANAPVMFACTAKDSKPVWIEQGGEADQWCIRRGDAKSAPFTLPDHAGITAVRHIQSDIIIGTDSGMLYRLSDSIYKDTDGSSIVTPDIPVALNTDTGTKAVDICVKDDTLCILTKKELYVQEGFNGKPVVIAENHGSNKCLAYQNGFLIWTQHKKMPVYYVESGQKPAALYYPKENIAALSVYGNTIAIVHSYSGLILLNADAGTKVFTYQGTGLQEVVQIDDDFLLISKSGSEPARCPLFLIHLKTSETISLPVKGSLAFSLTRDTINPTQFSCLRLSDSTGKTDLVRMHIDTIIPARSSFTSILSYKDEDLRAALYDDSAALLTTLGKNALVYYKKTQKQMYKMVRDYALPRKAVVLKNSIVSLNYGGSLSWFERKSLRLVATTILPQQK